jgi:uncharacterized protein YgfB (UPF0149 family)
MLAATYDEFERVLRDARALPEPAEAHGTLAGAMCSSRDYGLLEWLHEILPDDSPDDQALKSSVLQNRRAEPVVPGLPLRPGLRLGRGPFQGVERGR